MKQATLENEETKKSLKSFYFWFSWGSICLIPVVYYGVFAGYVVEYGRYWDYYYQGNQLEANIYAEKTLKL